MIAIVVAIVGDCFEHIVEHDAAACLFSCVNELALENARERERARRFERIVEHVSLLLLV